MSLFVISTGAYILKDMPVYSFICGSAGFAITITVGFIISLVMLYHYYKSENSFSFFDLVGVIFFTMFIAVFLKFMEFGVVETFCVYPSDMKGPTSAYLFSESINSCSGEKSKNLCTIKVSRLDGALQSVRPGTHKDIPYGVEQLSFRIVDFHDGKAYLKFPSIWDNEVFETNYKTLIFINDSIPAGNGHKVKEGTTYTAAGFVH